MLNVPKNASRVVAASGALCGCALVTLMCVVNSGGRIENVSVRRTENDPTTIVRSANEAAAAAFAEHVNGWRNYMASVRSKNRIEKFVDALLGLKQKAGYAWDAVQGASADERAMSLFRQRVLDERQLVADLEATLAAYDRVLFEQDRQFYEPAGIARDQWARIVQRSLQPRTSDWRQAMRPVLAKVTAENHRDMSRFLATNAAGQVVGGKVKSIARESGWDETEEGGVADRVSGFLIGMAADAAISAATDPSKRIVSELIEGLKQAEHELLEGSNGLFAEMQRLDAAHAAARKSILSSSQQQ